MEIKICSKCSGEFIKKQEHGSICQPCKNAKQRARRRSNGDIDTKKYEKSFDGYLMRTYRNMSSRVKGILKKKAHLYLNLEILDKEDFYNWVKNNDEYRTLHQTWVASNYEYWLAPSIDRIDSSQGYVLSNMRWLPHWENSKLGSISRHNKT